MSSLSRHSFSLFGSKLHSPALLTTLNLPTNASTITVLDDFTPSISLSINYPSSHESVNLGNDIPVKSVGSRPVFEFHPFNAPHLSPLSISNDTVYTLALTDPDATSRSNPKWGEMCHWIVTNLTLTPESSSSSFSILSEPGELVGYQPPSPPPSTGSHRYVFVLLASPTKDDVGTPSFGLKAPKDRKHWGFKRTRDGKKVGERKGKKGKSKTPRTVGVAKWAEKMGLEVVGVNFFSAQNEEQ